MNRGICLFFFSLTIILLLGIIVTISMPRPKVSIFKKKELFQIIQDVNKDLPREIGTIATFNHISYSNLMLVYDYTLKGSNNILLFYRDNTESIKQLLLYHFILMNGNFNLGYQFIYLLDYYNLDCQYNLYINDGDCFICKLTKEEIKEFVEACKISPTEALNIIIDMHLEFEKNSNLGIQSIVINSIDFFNDSINFLKEIKHINNNIIFVSEIYDEGFNFKDIEIQANNEAFLDAMAAFLAQDKNMIEFINLIVLSNSNLEFIFENPESKEKVSFVITNNILKRYSNISFFK